MNELELKSKLAALSVEKYLLMRRLNRLEDDIKDCCFRLEQLTEEPPKPEPAEAELAVAAKAVERIERIKMYNASQDGKEAATLAWLRGEREEPEQEP